MINWILNRLGYVRAESLETTIVYYKGRLMSQAAAIDRRDLLLHANHRKIEDLNETINILRGHYDA